MRLLTPVPRSDRSVVGQLEKDRMSLKEPVSLDTRLLESDVSGLHVRQVDAVRPEDRNDFQYRCPAIPEEIHSAFNPIGNRLGRMLKERAIQPGAGEVQNKRWPDNAHVNYQESVMMRKRSRNTAPTDTRYSTFLDSLVYRDFSLIGVSVLECLDR